MCTFSKERLPKYRCEVLFSKRPMKSELSIQRILSSRSFFKRLFLIISIWKTTVIILKRLMKTVL